MKKIRTLVVDDEPLARLRIVNLLNKIDYVSVIGECKNGREALKSIKSYKPDLVFLDIQMPDLNGFDVLSQAQFNPIPFIIFVTAYDQYALKAFDVHAVDYLLKPFDDERFITALEHAKEQLDLKENAFLHQKMVRLLENYKHQHSDELSAIEIKDRGRSTFINIEDIHSFETQGNYVKIHLVKKTYLYRETLQNIEQQVNPHIFLRIHRSLLLNTNYVKKVKYQGNNQFLFTLQNGQSLLSSRSYREDIVNYMDAKEIQ